MDVAEGSLGPPSKKRKQETVETAKTAPTESWDALFTWSGTTLAESAHDICLLCWSCRSLLVRPACDPNSQIGTTLH
jgi:hypothetical protein